MMASLSRQFAHCAVGLCYDHLPPTVGDGAKADHQLRGTEASLGAGAVTPPIPGFR
jgi:hypothetical protein